MTTKLTTAQALIASLSQAQAGTDGLTFMTPERVADAIAALSVPSGLEFVGSVVVSTPVASVQMDNVFELGYNYKLVVTNYRQSSDGQHARIAVSNDGNVTQETSGYIYMTGQTTSAGAAAPAGASSQSYIFPFLALGNAVNEAACYDMTIYNPMDVNERFHCSYSGVYEKNTAVSYALAGAGARDVLEAVDSLYWETTSGNIESATFSLYREKMTA